MSPKSVPLPVVDIVTNSILSCAVGVFPPANNPRVGDDAPPNVPVPVAKLPKSCALPVVAVVKKSIVSLLVFPPPNILLVALEFVAR